MSLQKIGFIGLGLIGGSIAKKLHALHPELTIIATAHHAETVAEAYKEHLIINNTPCELKDFADCDYIFLCTPTKKNIEYLVEGKKNHTPTRKRMYYKNLGEITHYVADYFTFPHNKTYPGSLKDHCAYEEKLKQDLRAFLKTEKAKQIGREKDRDFDSLEELFSYVKQQHEAYLKKRSNVEKDIEHIVVINRQLVDAIAQLFHNHKSHHKMA